MVETGWSSLNLVVYPIFIHFLSIFYVFFLGERSFMNKSAFGGDKWIGLPAKRWNDRWRWRLEDKVLSTKMTWRESQCIFWWQKWWFEPFKKFSFQLVTQDFFLPIYPWLPGTMEPMILSTSFYGMVCDSRWSHFLFEKNESRVEDILKAKLSVELNGCSVSTLIEI